MKITTQTKSISLADLVVDIAANQIFYNEDGRVKRLQIEPRIVSVISYFYQNMNSVISREQLIEEVWNGQVVSDNAISRSISQVRKLLNLSKTGKCIIETIPKVGYRLNLESNENIDQGILRYEKKVKKNNFVPFGNLLNRSIPKYQSKRDFAAIKVLSFAGFTLAIILSPFFSSKEEVRSTPEFKQSTLTSDRGVEKQARFSPDDEGIAYVHSAAKSPEEFLYYVDQENKEVTQITRRPYLILHYAWSPDSRSIVYSHWKDSHRRDCGVNLLKLNENKKPISDEKIMSCSERSAVRLAWNSKGDKIYFTERASFDRPYSIFSYSFSSKRTTQLTLPPQSGNFRGDYFLEGNMQGSKILVGRYAATKRIELSVYDTKTDQKTTPDFVIEDITGASWFGNSDDLLVTIDNKLFVYNYKREELLLYYPIAKRSSSFYSNRAENKIAFTQSYIDINLNLVDLKTKGLVKQVTNSTSNEVMPSYANLSGQLAYLSDKSGEYQIWVVDELGNHEMVSDSPVSISVTPLKWSPNDQYILFQHLDEIFTLDVVGRKIERVIDLSHKAYVANWSFDGRSIFYSSEKSGEWQIWQYYLESNVHRQITIEGGYSANQHASGDIYLSRIHQHGLWRLSPDPNSSTGFALVERVLEDFDATNWISWQLTDESIYFYGATNENKGLYSLDLTTKKRSFLFPMNQDNLRYFSVKENQLLITVMENRESSIEIFEALNTN